MEASVKQTLSGGKSEEKPQPLSKMGRLWAQRTHSNYPAYLARVIHFSTRIRKFKGPFENSKELIAVLRRISLFDKQLPVAIVFSFPCCAIGISHTICLTSRPMSEFTDVLRSMIRPDPPNAPRTAKWKKEFHGSRCPRRAPPERQASIFLVRLHAAKDLDFF
jgi:hypothetical protein